MSEDRHHAVPLVYAPEILEVCDGDPAAAAYLARLLARGRLAQFKRFCSGVIVTIPDVIDRFRAYHDVHLAWGSLHVVLDDGNIGDDSVRGCIGYAQEVGDVEGEALARILLTMSKTQRLKIGSRA